MNQHPPSINLKARSHLLLVLLLIFPALSFAGNPFLHMIGRPYAENMMELRQIYFELDFMDQAKADSLKLYMEEAASVANDDFWKLELKSFYITYHFRYNARLTPNSTYTLANAIDDIKAIYQEAREINDTVYYTKVLRGLMNAYILDKDYDQAFQTAALLDKELEHISVSRQPEKVMIYREIAELHYKFRNYPEAEIFFKKLVREPEANRYLALRPAYNGLGLIYRYHYRDYDKSDEYFRLILTVPGNEYCDDEHLLAWEGIAKGNLGNNLYLQKKYDEAIPLLESSRLTMLRVNDYTFASSMAALLADIYLEQKKAAECKHYIDTAVSYIRQSYPNQHWARIYPVMAKYYAMTGHSQLAQAYQDSALTYQKREFEEYDALKLLYANLRINQLEHEAKDQELHTEHLRAEKYKNMAIYVAIGLLIIACALCYGIILYRKKRKAYRALVKKSQEWASAKKTPLTLLAPEPSVDPVTSDNPVVPTEADMALMQRIRKLMDEEKVYIDPGFGLADMAQRLEVNRTYISATINRCMGKTLTSFMNEYRVMLAIDIMSSPGNQALTIDAVADASGFNDRKSFYRAFKKITGLAPSEFRANVTIPASGQCI